jgi:RND family efflux transporter MFP subunit
VLGTEPAALNPLDCVLEPYEVVEVSSAVQGVINEIHVDRNDMVEKGQLLVELDADVERTQVELARARAELKTAIELRETELAFHRRNEQRLEKLYEKDTVSLHIKDEAETDTQKSELQLRSAIENKRLAELELAKAEAVLALRSMRSPISGIVVARNKVAGEFVEDQSILRLAQLNPLKVEVIAPVELFGSITEGMQVEVRPEQAGQEAQYATVTMVDRMIDPASGTFDVRAELPNPDLAIPSGLRCTAQFRDEPAPAEQIARATSPAPVPVSPFLGDTDAPVGEAAAKAPATDKPATEEAATGDVALNDVATDKVAHAEGPIEEAAPEEALIAEAGIADGNEQQAPMETDDGVAAPQQNPASGELVFAASIPVPETFCASESRIEIQGYRVLADPAANDSPTRELVDQLADNGINDLYVVTRGANRGKVSLGYYSQLDNAEKRQLQVANQGFAVSLAPRTREIPNPDCDSQAQLADANH